MGNSVVYNLTTSNIKAYSENTQQKLLASTDHIIHTDV